MFVTPSDALTRFRDNNRTKSSSRVETGGRKIGNGTAGDVCVGPAITFLGLVPGVCRWIAAATAAAFAAPATAAAFVFGDTKAAKTAEGTKATKGTKEIKGAQAIETAEAVQDVVLVHQA